MHARPALPTSAGDYSFESRLASIRRRHLGGGAYEYSGSYTPLRPGDCELLLDLRASHPTVGSAEKKSAHQQTAITATTDAEPPIDLAESAGGKETECEQQSTGRIGNSD